MKDRTRILFCECIHANIVPGEVKRRVLSHLQESHIAFDVVQDLCGLAANKASLLREMADSADLRIAACYPRAVKCLFNVAGAPLDDDNVQILNMRTENADTVISRLLTDAVGGECSACGTSCTPARAKPDPAPELQFKPELQSRPAPGAKSKPDPWMPWFPVIDQDRCTNCKQCLSFCLFGVFGLGSDGHVEVQHPANCKTGCPACSRVCPTVAIVFPKYDKSPINGDEVREDDPGQDPVKVDVGKLVDGGVQASLRARSGRAGERFSTDRKPDAEGLARLRKMQTELDIPKTVIDGLTAECALPCSCECSSPECVEGKAAAPVSVGCACDRSGDGGSDSGCDCNCSTDTTATSDGECASASCCCDEGGDGETPTSDKKTSEAGASGPSGSCACSCDCSDDSDDSDDSEEDTGQEGTREEWDL